MAKYSYLRFFNGVENELNLDYDATNEKWNGVVYLPEVSVGLYETFNLFILEELVDSNGHIVYGRPISANSSGSNFTFSWKADRYSSEDVFIYGTQLEDNVVKVQSLDGLNIQVLDHTDVVSIVAGLKTVNGFTNTAIQANIALSSQFEKRHERTLIITDDNDGHVVAEIVVYGETVGEDERMRDLLQNLGATLDDGDFIIFKEHDINEMGIDWMLMNKKRKELLLELHNIKPFIGTYKAVLNAIDFFGYNKITLKEYWLNINQDSDSFGKLKAVSVPDRNAGFSYKKRKQFNLPSTTMKKTSRFSLVYKLNEPDETFDYWDIPNVQEVFDFTPEEILIKLYGLKNKLQKEYLPLQAKIIDITGEGSYFDQKNLNVWNNQQPIASFNEGKDVEFKVYPENKQLYIEDYALVSNSGILIDNVDFQPIQLNEFGNLSETDYETLLSDFETFYNNYYINKKETFNNDTPGEHSIPVGAPVILECTSLPHEWEFANFTWLDAIDPTITWNNWWKQHVYELEWVVTGPKGYSQNFRGSIGYYEADGTFHPGFLRFPMIVPHEGDYTVELRMYDLQGFMSFRKESDLFNVKVKPLEIYGIYQWKENNAWKDWKTAWNKTGGYWDIPSENLQKVQDSFQSLYLTMDRSNYIKDEDQGKIFSTVRRYLDTDLSNPTGYAETTGPYSWDEMENVRWIDGKYNWWNATRIGMDLTASFKIDDIQQGSVLTLTHLNPTTNLTETGTHTILATTPSGNTDIAGWQAIADELNNSTDSIISKFNYNPVFEDTDNDGINDVFLFMLCVGRAYSRTYDFETVELTNGNVLGEVHYVNYNPTFDTVRIINGSAEVERSTHITFALDKSQMAGIKTPIWKIYKDSSQIERDIYYDNMWLTYIFKEAGSYRISAEVEDTNGNTNIVERNMIIVK
tara:strand:+ start:13873 stop:16620 length:2748 start_codon:yes stop_codon:yes gene_type:complete